MDWLIGSRSLKIVISLNLSWPSIVLSENCSRGIEIMQDKTADKTTHFKFLNTCFLNWINKTININGIKRRWPVYVFIAKAKNNTEMIIQNPLSLANFTNK